MYKIINWLRDIAGKDYRDIYTNVDFYCDGWCYMCDGGCKTYKQEDYD